jgi:hypothetical protein
MLSTSEKLWRKLLQNTIIASFILKEGLLGRQGEGGGSSKEDVFLVKLPFGYCLQFDIKMWV